MATSKKVKLINSLKKLEMDEAFKSLLRTIEKMNFSKEPDLNATLTRMIFYKVLSAYPSVMTSPKSKTLKLFCEQEIGPIKELSLKSSPKNRR